MASTSGDVIELGSSDDEALPPEPRKIGLKIAPVKVRPVPRLNAMVNIPKNIHGLTIKPAKPARNLTKQMGKTGPSVTPSNFLTTGKLNNQTTIKPLQSNKHPSSTSKVYPGSKVLDKRNVKVPIPINTNAGINIINPISLIKNFDKSQIVINKVVGSSKSNIATVRTPKTLVNPMNQAIRPNPVARLPASVTVTKTQRGTKHPMISNVTSLKKKQKVLSSPKLVNIAPKKPNLQIVNHKVASAAAVDPLRQTGEVLTVELDDDAAESSSSKSNPQWYMRPEEQTNEEAKELEKLNNKEPEAPKFIEICIEDSPVHKLKNRRESEIDNAIIIEDSPVRHGTPKKTAADSDSENDDGNHRRNKPKKKRRKLDYSVEVPILEKSIEIEIEPMEVEAESEGKKDDTAKHEDEPNRYQKTTEISKERVTDDNNETVIEVCESPAKAQHKINREPREIEPNKPSSKRLHEEKSSDVELVAEEEEFHPVYQQFINLCFKLDNSNDMKTIVEKKIKGYYKQVPKEYTESEEFIDMVSSKILSMKAGKEKMYLYIKDVVDELNIQRKVAKSELIKKQTEIKESGKLTFTDDSEFDSKRQRQIRKLEKTIRKLHRAIQKLEEQEVDFDDEDDSVYLLTERYKERMVRVHAKLCQLTNTKLPSEPRVHIESRPGQPTGPAKRLEKWINKKVPIGKPLPFPDFHDVLRIVREANSEDKLGWNEADIMEEARDLFTRCGKKLQRRRQEIEWRIAASRLPADVDPAEDNDDLKSKLERNRHIASKKELDLFNKYAERQSEMKLEGEEIGDKEAEESPSESEDDEVIEESSALADKEKRKIRLKRLIQEKSHKKSSEDKGDVHIMIEEDSITLEGSADENLQDEKDPLNFAVNTEPEINNTNEKSVEQQPQMMKEDKDKAEQRTENKEPENAKPLSEVADDVGKGEQHVSDKEPEKEENQLGSLEERNKEPEKEENQLGILEERDNKTEISEEKIETNSKTNGEIEINSDSDASEVDELHLLEKLYSESENNSSSDSDTPIDISDTVDSDDAKGKDVISIENSSESDTQNSNPKEDDNKTKPSAVTEEILSSNDGPMEPQIQDDDATEKRENGHDRLEADSNKINSDSIITPSDHIVNDEIDFKNNDESMESSEPHESVNAEVEESVEHVLDSIESIIESDKEKVEDDTSSISSQLVEKELVSAEVNKQKDPDKEIGDSVSVDETVIEKTVVQENHVNDNKTDTFDCERLTEEDNVTIQNGDPIETTLSISTHDLATADFVEETIDNNAEMPGGMSANDESATSI